MGDHTGKAFFSVVTVTTNFQRGVSTEPVPITDAAPVTSVTSAVSRHNANSCDFSAVTLW